MTPGERVIEGDPVVRLVNPENLEVIVRAPLDYYSFVERGQVLALTAGERSVSGTVRTVVAIGNLSTHQFELRLDLDGRPFPVGQTLRVAIPVSDSRAVLTVPRDALVLRPGGQSVFVVADDDTARQVPVTVGVGQGRDLEIMGDIQPGDRVVIRGNERLQAGQQVRLME
jgi:RND family efflux transporter MFP subunit